MLFRLDSETAPVAWLQCLTPDCRIETVTINWREAAEIVSALALAHPRPHLCDGQTCGVWAPGWVKALMCKFGRLEELAYLREPRSVGATRYRRRRSRLRLRRRPADAWLSVLPRPNGKVSA